MTRQRQVILDELRKLTSHPTADEVYQLVRRRLPHISLGTVYRNLEILAQNDMVRKLEFGGSQRRFDGTVDNHYHVRCRQCGRMEDLSVEPLIDLNDVAASQTRFHITGHRLEFMGLCPDCQAQAAE